MSQMQESEGLASRCFAFDLSRLEQCYRVLAATILGVALLAMSFLYQRDRERPE